jgi:hypothetical protein
VTAALIALPFLAALLVGFLPLSRVATEGLAFVAALAAAVLAAIAIIGYDVGGRSQYVTCL